MTLTKSQLYDEFAASGKALANGHRLELLDLLAQGERTVERLASTAGLRVTTASAHLQVLRNAGFVSSRRDGVRVYYRLAGDDVAQLLVRVRRVAERHRAGVVAAREAYLGTAPTPEVSWDQLINRAAAGTIVILDVRPLEEYSAGHIPGARSIPIDQLAQRVGELDDDAEIVVYCRGEYCALAYDAVRYLSNVGRRAIRLRDGMLEWRLADLPVATG
jgi:rhodanese-related sulfurtransferase/DNA-binding transcriptional ArsR family regulator